MTAERDRILGNGAYDNDLGALRADYRFVFLGDLISLVFCCEWSDVFRYEGYTIARRGSTLQVAPDPFAGQGRRADGFRPPVAGAVVRLGRRSPRRVRPGPCSVSLQGTVRGASS